MGLDGDIVKGKGLLLLRFSPMWNELINSTLYFYLSLSSFVFF